MEKDRSARLIAIVALVLAVTGVSIGFAVLSTNLTIEPPVANVKANDDLFTVYFSKSASAYEYGNGIAPTLSETVSDFAGNNINIAQNSTTISGIGGTFTKPGQTITYNIGVSNESKLNGYLTAITFGDADGGKKVKCEAVADDGNAIESSELESVCDDITVSVNVGSKTYNAASEGIDALSGIAIATKTTIPLTITITYDADAVPATGDFKATFGNIVLGFQTKDNAGAGA